MNSPCFYRIPLFQDITIVQRAPRTHRDIRSPEEVTEEDLEMVADSTSDKSYDSYYVSRPS